MRWANMHPRGPIFFRSRRMRGSLDLLDFSVPNVFPKLFHKFSIPPHFILYPLPSVLLMQPIQAAQKERSTMYWFWDCPKPWFKFLVLGQSPMYITKRKKLNFGVSPHLINTSQTYAIHHCTKDVQKHRQFSSREIPTNLL